MSRTNSIVEVNGNLYDALTGELISRVKKASSRVPRPSGKKMIDGFVVAANRSPSRTGKVGSRATNPAPAAHGLHTKHQRSKTLMRKAVKKPSSLKIVDSKAPQSRGNLLSPIRELRAKTITLNSKVNRFGALPNSRSESIATDARGRQLGKKRLDSLSSELAAPVPSLVTSVSHQKLERLLDEALVKADAHKQMMRRGRFSRVSLFKRLPKWPSLIIGFLILVIAALILIWQHLPSVAVRVAAARAHVSASLPSYTPAGYGLAQPIKYQSGSVSLKFLDKANSSSFALTQQNSNLDSSSLANTLPKDVPVQTSQVSGTTVYIYGSSSDASWVNQGVLYNLQNKAGLSSDQIMKIVSSL